MAPAAVNESEINSHLAAATKNKSEWLIHVERSLGKDEVEADANKSKVCIFGLAHTLLRRKPEVYIPQVISIGPYHHRKLKQYEETDAYKLEMARALERDFSPFKFTKLVERVRSLEDRIRACYHKHIPYDVETLSWMLALDASFIVQFLVSSYRIYGVHTTAGSRLMHKPTILQFKRKTPLWYAMKNDILMLENQVPMFLLLEALYTAVSEGQTEISQDTGGIRRVKSQIEIDQDTVRSQEKIETSQDTVRLQEKIHLASILQAACLHFNPFLRAGTKNQRERSQHNEGIEIYGDIEGIRLTRSQSQIEKENIHLSSVQAALPAEDDVDTINHVLGCLYNFVIAASREPQKKASESVLYRFKKTLSKAHGKYGIVLSRFKEGLFKARGSVLFRLKKSLFKDGRHLGKVQIHSAGGIGRKEGMHPAGGIDRNGGINDSIKKMTSATTAGNLPCATELSEAGIKFASYDSGHLEEIRFDRKTSTLFLPKIKIDDSTEVVLRNLVALELNLKKEHKPLTRYTYLMDRLIDTKRDVALLRRREIFISKMGSDEEVAQMWNSMSKSTWENTFDPVDKAIEEVHKHYSSKWRVVLAEFLKTYCSKPWLVIGVLSAAVLLLLTIAQVFCLFYTCNKLSTSN